MRPAAASRLSASCMSPPGSAHIPVYGTLVIWMSNRCNLSSNTVKIQLSTAIFTCCAAGCGVTLTGAMCNHSPPSCNLYTLLLGRVALVKGGSIAWGGGSATSPRGASHGAGQQAQPATDQGSAVHGDGWGKTSCGEGCNSRDISILGVEQEPKQRATVGPTHTQYSKVMGQC